MFGLHGVDLGQVLFKGKVCPSQEARQQGEEEEFSEHRRIRGMRKFDPWPVFFRREWNRNWPFLVGFAITGAVITKISLGLTGNLFFRSFIFV